MGVVQSINPENLTVSPVWYNTLPRTCFPVTLSATIGLFWGMAPRVYTRGIFKDGGAKLPKQEHSSLPLQTGSSEGE
jgi:hypothetical protein